ncbi:ACT domain-containing protein [Vibrio rumoiensis]|nr:ACT domain-containing protein [Vibrio rumoiensis]
MSESTLFIVNFSGEAQPTSLKRLALMSHQSHARWVVSKINYLDQQVAGLIKIECPTDQVNAIQQAFLSEPSLTVHFAPATPIKHPEEEVYELRFDTDERSGIVSEITHTLEKERAQILSIHSHRVFLAGETGIQEGMFTSRLSIQIPSETNIQDIISELQAISAGTRVINETL